MTSRVLSTVIQVEIDVAVSDERLILIEASLHACASDIYTFKRKTQLYEKTTGKKPSRLLIVTPYADEKALIAAENMGIEIYTKV